MSKELNLGLIGISEGNGHPFSWSSIINGNNHKYLNKCPYPIIRDYLTDKKNLNESIKNVNVTHIWTQKKEFSKAISDFSNIPNIVSDFKDMIGSVDGLLLARDDYENHHKFSEPFLEAGIPVYIDKPIAVSKNKLDTLLSSQLYSGQIFSHSALRFAKEFNFGNNYLNEFGIIKEIIAISPKDWPRYSIHIIEPVLNSFNLNDNFHILNAKQSIDGRSELEVKWEDNLMVQFITTGQSTDQFSIEIRGTNKEEVVKFNDTYNAFKTCILEFINGIQNKSNFYPEKELYLYVELIEAGL